MTWEISQSLVSATREISATWELSANKYLEGQAKSEKKAQPAISIRFELPIWFLSHLVPFDS